MYPEVADHAKFAAKHCERDPACFNFAQKVVLINYRGGGGNAVCAC